MDTEAKSPGAVGKRMGSRRGGATRRAKPLRHRPCQVCRHPDRLRIELLRLSGLSLDLVSARFRVHRDAVHRHMLHISDADRAALIADLAASAP